MTPAPFCPVARLIVAAIAPVEASAVNAIAATRHNFEVGLLTLLQVEASFMVLVSRLRNLNGSLREMFRPA
jgi:hypothetical protein